MRWARHQAGQGRRERFDVVFVMLHAGPLLMAQAGTGGGWTGGAETQVFLLARELRRRGHRVAIATFEVPGGLPETVESVEVIALPPRPPDASLAEQLDWCVRFVLAIARIQGSVFVQRTAGAITGLAALLARLRRERFVYSTSGIFDFDYGKLEHNRWALCAFELGRRLADTIVVQNNDQVELCRRRWRRCPTVIRSVVEPMPARAGAAEAFLWIGRFASYKRPEIMLDLAKRVPDARFWMLAGSVHHQTTDVVDDFRRRAAQVPNLELLEPRTRRELAAVYDRAVAVINTSESEGMSNVLLEAWARGVPALLFSHDPDGLVVREGLGWCAEGSLDRLTDLAAEAWAHRDNQADVADRCRAYVARVHLADGVAEQWERVLNLQAP